MNTNSFHNKEEKLNNNWIGNPCCLIKSQINYILGGSISLHYFVIRFPMCLTLLCLPDAATPNNRKTHDLNKRKIGKSNNTINIFKTKYETSGHKLLSNNSDKKSPGPSDAAGDEYLSASSSEMNISKYKHHLAQYSPGPRTGGVASEVSGCQPGLGCIIAEPFISIQFGSLVQSDKNTIVLFLLPSLKLSARCHHSLMTNNWNIFPRLFICTNDTV